MRIHTVLNPLCVTTYMLTLERVQTHPLAKRLNYEKKIKGMFPLSQRDWVLASLLSLSLCPSLSHNHCIHLVNDGHRTTVSLQLLTTSYRLNLSMPSVICTSTDRYRFWASLSSCQLNIMLFVASTSQMKILENFGAEHHCYKMAQHLMAVPSYCWKEKDLERESPEANFI